MASFHNYIAYVASLLLLGHLISAQTPISVTIPSYGQVEGSYTQPPGPSFERLNSFLGIPYAKAPTGNLRFEPPTSPDPLVSTLQATSFGSKCLQLVGSSQVGDEDCLFLNIYVPGNLDSHVLNKIPVMFFIHGMIPGQENSGDDYTGEYLTKQEQNTPVILVTINYRLGVLGFATSGNDIIPGNMGYKDQAFAIEWVHDNIQYFGGDNTKITVFGQGSGAEAVKAHILSPMNAGKFQRAIVQSGGPLWAYPDKRDNEMTFDLFGSFMGCLGDHTAIRVCLQGKNAADIVGVTSNDVAGIDMLAQPVVDGMFLPSNPQEMLEAGTYNAVQLMVGFNSDDGSLFATKHADEFPNFLEGVSTSDPAIDAALMACVHHTAGGDLSQDRTDDLITTMREEYFASASTNDDVTRAALDMVRDCIFVAHSLDMAAKFAEGGHPTFVYIFDHRTESLTNPFNNIEMNAEHASEIPYVFGYASNVNDPDYNNNEQLISQSIMKAWYTFASDNSPEYHDLGYNIKTWPVFTRSSPMMVSFDDASLASGNAEVSAADSWLPVHEFWAADVRDQLQEEEPTEVPQPQPQTGSCEKEFKTDILGFDEFEADLAIILLAVAVVLLLIAVLFLLCRVCGCCESKQDKYYEQS